MHHPLALQDSLNRRVFLRSAGSGLGAAALATLLNPVRAAESGAASPIGLPGFPTGTPKAKRIIWLFQSGAPSQLDLFDPSRGLRPIAAKTSRSRSARVSDSPP